MSTWYDVEKMEKVRLFLEENLECPVSKRVGAPNRRDKPESSYEYYFFADGGKFGSLQIPRKIHDDNDSEGLLLKIEIQKVLTKMKAKKEIVALE